VESEFLIKSLGISLSSLVNIDDSPLLMSASIVGPDTNLLSFNIFASSNVKYLLVVEVDELLILILEDLPPSRVGAPDLQVVGSS